MYKTAENWLIPNIIIMLLVIIIKIIFKQIEYIFAAMVRHILENIKRQFLIITRPNNSKTVNIKRLHEIFTFKKLQRLYDYNKKILRKFIVDIQNNISTIIKKKLPAIS